MPENSNTIFPSLILIDHLENLTFEEREELRGNCNYILNLFGKNWLFENKNNNHPLKGFLGSSTGLLQLGELAQGIKSLIDKQNFYEIYKRLPSTEEFYGAYDEIRVANSLLKIGVQFNFIPKYKKTKSPDIQLHLSERDVFLEITGKEYPQEYLDAYENYKKILITSLEHHGDFRNQMKIYRPLSKPRTREILQKMEELKKQVSITGFAEFHIKGVIDLTYFSKENLDKVPINVHNKQNVYPKFDEIPRIKGTIVEKARQLNKNCAGILFIFDNILFPTRNIKRFLSRLKTKIEETVYDQENVSALVIFTEYVDIDGENKNFMSESDSYFSMTSFNPKTGIQTSKLAIFNKYSTHPLTDSEKQILKNIM